MVLKFVGYDDSELNEIYHKVYAEQLSKINFDAPYKYVDPERFSKNK